MNSLQLPALLTSLVTEDPSQLDAYELARVRLRLAGQDGTGYEAISDVWRRSHPPRHGAGTMVGMLKEAQGDRAGARAAYRAGRQGNPKAAVAANNLAWIYAEEGKLDDALRLATQRGMQWGGGRKPRTRWDGFY